MPAPIHHGAIQFQQDPLQTLRDGQAPKVMFITCSDSRLVLSMLTGTGPGELFVMRNAGNIVPPYGAGDVSSAATIEYGGANGDANLYLDDCQLGTYSAMTLTDSSTCGALVEPVNSIFGPTFLGFTYSGNVLGDACF